MALAPMSRIGNCQLRLVRCDEAIVWGCAPGFDASTLRGLLDEREEDRFAISLCHERRAIQRSVHNRNATETHFEATDGALYRLRVGSYLGPLGDR